MDFSWYEDTSCTPSSRDADAEWDKMASEFTNAGYREGITAGKESALQEGFDAGFADIGAPLGRELGLLRGMVAAILVLQGRNRTALTEATRAEAQTIAAALKSIQFADVVPRDREAEEHARAHLESAEKSNGILAFDSTTEDADVDSEKAKEVQALKTRLGALTRGIGLENGGADIGIGVEGTKIVEEALRLVLTAPRVLRAEAPRQQPQGTEGGTEVEGTEIGVSGANLRTDGLASVKSLPIHADAVDCLRAFHRAHITIWYIRITPFWSKTLRDIICWFDASFATRERVLIRTKGFEGTGLTFEGIDTAAQGTKTGAAGSGVDSDGAPSIRPPCQSIGDSRKSMPCYPASSGRYSVYTAPYGLRRSASLQFFSVTRTVQLGCERWTKSGHNSACLWDKDAHISIFSGVETLLTPKQT